MTALALITWGAAPPQWLRGPITQWDGLDAVTTTRPWQPPDSDWVLFWDPSLGCPDSGRLEDLMNTTADAHHGGLDLGMRGQPIDLDLAQPAWQHLVDPDPGVSGVSWRVSVRALLIRRQVLGQLQFLDDVFESAAAVGLDIGLQLLHRGAVSRFAPALVPRPTASPAVLPPADVDALLDRHLHTIWARYTRARSAARQADLRRIGGLRTSTSPRATTTPITRAPVQTPRPVPTVSLILPTLGRYDLLTPVLRQLSNQTLPATELIVVDQNDPADRRPEIYDSYTGGPIHVVFQDAKGQWTSRNAAIRLATGDYLAFVDDDSEVESTFLEAHLEGLLRYGADASTGASIATVGAPPPADYSYFHVAPQFDSGNAMVTREILERVGSFDLQFDRMRAGDGDFGLRVREAGGLVIHNPNARRIHLKAEAGGLRAFGSWDVYRQAGWLSPKPLPSILYYNARHFTRRQQREALAQGLALAAIPYHRKAQTGPARLSLDVLGELVRAPLTAIRVGRSLRCASRIWDEGPQIPRVRP